MHKPTYFDYHASTPVDPRVLESMMPYFTEHFGNASSKQHAFGWSADFGVEKARKQIADLLGATAQEIVFTSGGTESNNMVIMGVWESFRDQGCHFITTQVEHKAILEPLHYLETHGAKVTYLPVDNEGHVRPQDIAAAIRPETRLVSVIYGNNEIGTINPIDDIAEICTAKDVLFHTDAVQALGKMNIDVQKTKIDLLSISAHKIYGPKGVGALYIRKRSPRIRLHPLMMGGGQERGIRSGTLNVPGIVGLGKSCEILKIEGPAECARLREYQNYMFQEFSKIPDSLINGDLKNRLCNNISITINGIRSNFLISALKDMAISTGSACSTQSVVPSYVLMAIGRSEEEAVSTIRFGLGRFTTQNEVECGVRTFISAIEDLRKKSRLGSPSSEALNGSHI